ncbi:MAG: hypothetical protein ACXVBC_05725 [Bdellovibrionota bacterium]
MFIFALTSALLALAIGHRAGHAEEELCPEGTVKSGLKKRRDEVTTQTFRNAAFEDAGSGRRGFGDLRVNARQWFEQHLPWSNRGAVTGPRVSWMEVTDLKEIGEMAGKPRPPVDTYAPMLSRDYTTWYSARIHGKPVRIKVFDPFRMGSGPPLLEGYLATFMNEMHLPAVPFEGFIGDVAYDAMNVLVPPETMMKAYIQEVMADTEKIVSHAASAKGTSKLLSTEKLLAAKAKFSGLKSNWERYLLTGKQDADVQAGIVAGLRDTLGQLVSPDTVEAVLGTQSPILNARNMGAAVIYRDIPDALEITKDVDSLIVRGEKIPLARVDQALIDTYRLNRDTLNQMTLVGQQLEFVGLRINPRTRIEFLIKPGGRPYVQISDISLPYYQEIGSPKKYSQETPAELVRKVTDKLKKILNTPR